MLEKDRIIDLTNSPVWFSVKEALNLKAEKENIMKKNLCEIKLTKEEKKMQAGAIEDALTQFMAFPPAIREILLEDFVEEKLTKFFGVAKAPYSLALCLGNSFRD